MKKIKGFSCGQFDLTHYGHYLMFEECKKQCDYLIVGLQTNANIDRKEKHKPIQSLEERRGQLRACRWIDKIIIYETEKDLYNSVPTEKVKVDTAIADLTKFAQEQGINYKILKIHNPWLRENKLNNTTRKAYYIEIPKEGYYSTKL
jgi:cytidyltransferase-like protein